MPRAPAVGPATRAMAPAPTLLSLPPEGASSPVTAQRRDPGWKAAPHPVLSPLPLEARPRGQPLQGRQARSPSPTPSSTRGSALHTYQHEGPARGPVPPVTQALPGPEEPVSTDGPDANHQGQLGLHVPSHRRCTCS